MGGSSMYDYTDLKRIFGSYGSIIKEEIVSDEAAYFVISPFSTSDGRKLYTKIEFIKDKYDNRVAVINSALFMKGHSSKLNSYIQNLNTGGKGGRYKISPPNVLEATKNIVLFERTTTQELISPWLSQMTGLQGAVSEANV